jgi:uncharacterized membrane protein (UPF0127 family)
MTFLMTTAYGLRMLDVEVARTPEQKACGLMGRAVVPPGTGMLFLYDPPQEVGMWMRNTLVPLDMLFVRPDGVVHRIESWAVPRSLERVGSRGPVAAVLEIGGGEAARMGIRPGDRVFALS